MAGSEKSGLSSAQIHLFENAYYILTPTKEVPEEWFFSFREFILAIKAIPLELDYREHDKDTSAISHVPHLIAAALVNTVHDLDNKEEHMKTIAAGGFRDITRIASSSPQMWEQICVDNQDNIIETMDSFIEHLQEARRHIAMSDGAYINQMFTKSGDYRNTFSFSTKGPIQNHFRIYCDIIDENGAIATIATILAVHNISIRNISIIHNREFEHGALGIEFYREDAMRTAVSILRHHRYTVWEND